MAGSLKFPTSFSGRLIALTFLGVWAACVMTPAAAVPVRFGLDWAVAWSALLVFALLFFPSILKSPGAAPLRLDFLDLLVFLGVLWVLLSAWNSSESFESFSAFKGFLALGFWWFALRHLWKKFPGLFPLFENLFRFSALVVAAWVLAGALLGRLEPFAGPFPNANFTAIFLGMALILWGIEWLHGNSNRSAFFLLFIFAAWGSTRSRGAFLALAVTLVFYLFAHYSEIEARLRRFKPRQWILFALVALFMLICSTSMIKRVIEGDKIDPRANFRTYVWSSAFHMACDQPLFGFGPGAFETLYPYYRSSDVWNTTTGFAHNELLQAAAECGWPAFALEVVFGLVLFWNAWHLARKNPPFRPLAPPLRAAEISLLFLVYACLDNLVDYTFHAWSIQLLLIAFFSFALRNERVSGIEINLQFSPSAFRGLAGLIFLLAFWVLGVGTARDELARLYYFKGQALEAQGDLKAAIEDLNRSLVFRSNLAEPWTLLGSVALAEAVHEKDPAVKTAYFHLAEIDFDQAALVSPRSVTPKENQVKLMEFRGRLDQALDLQAALTAQLPNLPTNYLEEGTILLAQGHPGEVLPVVQKAIDQDNYFLDAYFLKAKALGLLGRRSEVIQVYRDVEAKLKSAGLLDKVPLVENEIQKIQGRS